MGGYWQNINKKLAIIALHYKHHQGKTSHFLKIIRIGEGQCENNQYYMNDDTCGIIKQVLVGKTRWLPPAHPREFIIHGHHTSQFESHPATISIFIHSDPV